MTENYLSGKKRSLKLGVSGHSENLTSLETVGGVGIGTTNADKRALYVVGNTEIVGVLTAASYSGDGSGLTGVAATDHVATFDLVVAGITTFHDDVRVTAGGIDVTSGIVSATGLDIGTNGIDVDGQTDLDELVVAGVSTFSKAIDLNAGIDVDGQADLDELVVAGVATFTNSLKVDGAVDIGTGGLDVDGETQLDELVVAGVSTFTGNIVADTATFSGNVTIGGTLTVEDKTNVDSIGLITARTGVRVTAGGIDVTAGVSTFTDTVKFDGAVDIGTGGVDIDGQLDVDELIVAGVTTFSNDIRVGTAITIHAGNIHATGIISATKFVGDGSQITNLPGFNPEGTSSLTDVNVSGTTTTTQLHVSGIGTAVKLNVSTGGLDVDGQTDLDELVVAGVSTFSGYPSIDADNEIQVGTAIQLGKAGVITATKYYGDGSDLTGTSTPGINTTGTSSFQDVTIAGGLDVAGIGTFTGIYVQDDSGNNDVIIDNNYVSNHVYISLKDNCKAQFGNGTDLQIYHDASNSYVIDQGSGDLILGANDAVKITNGAGTENKIVATTDGSVELYYDNVKKLESTSVGATVYGNFKSTTLHVAGISTLTGDVSVVGSLDNVNVTGAALTAINIKAIGGNYTGVVTASSFSGNATSATTATTSTNVTVADESSDTSCNVLFVTAATGDLAPKSGTNLTFNSDTGALSATAFSGDGSALTGIGTQGPDGAFNGIVVSGISTFYDDVRITGGGINAVGVITATSFSGSGSGLTNLPTGISTTTASTFKDLALGGGLTVTGVSTFSSLVDVNNRIDVVGGANIDQLNVAGVSTFNDDIKLINNKELLIGDSGDIQIGYSGGGTPYIRTNKLRLQSVAGTEDYIGAAVGAGVSLYYDNIERVATTAEGIDVTGRTETDLLNVSGIATFGGNTINIATWISHNGDLDTRFGFYGPDELTFETGGTERLHINSSGLQVTNGAGLAVAGVSTFSKAVDINAGLDVDGQADLDELVVAGVATFSAYPSIDADNEIQVGTAIQLGKAGVITATSFSGSGSGLTGVGTQGVDIQARGLVLTGIATFYNDVKIVGGGSTAGNQITIGATTLNDGTLTFDGTAGQLFSISNNLTDGSIFSVNDVSGMPSIDVGAAGTIQLAPYGAGELVGIGTTRPTSKLDVVGDVQVVGVVTATSFSGSGANLTDLPGATDGSFIGLNVTGITTLGDDVTITAGGLVVSAGVVTATDLDISNNVDIDGTCEADAYTVNGTALDTHIAGVTVTNSTNSAHVYVTDNESTSENNLVTFVENAQDSTGNHGLEMDGTFTYNPSSGTVTATTFSGALSGNATSATTATTATNANHVYVTDNESTSENNLIAFVENAQDSTGNHGLEMDGTFTYNPGSGTVTATTFSGALTGNADTATSATTATNANHVYVTDNESTSENNLVTFVENAQDSTGNHGLEMDGTFTYNPGTGTVTATTFSGALSGNATSATSATTATTATNATHVYLTDNESTSENNLVAFVENAQDSTGNHGLEMDGTFTYNPGSGTVTATTFSGALSGNATSATSATSATNSTHVYVTDNESTDEENLIAFVEDAQSSTGNHGLEMDGNLTYNPSTGTVSATKFSGDGSALTGIEAGGTGDFYVGFTSSVTMNANSYEATGHTFASTASKTYTIDSIMASNVANVGVGTTVNLIASISSNSGVAAGTTEQTYFAYNIPIAAGGAIELIKEPIVANPNDIVKLWATDSTYTGISSAIQVHMTYTQQDSTAFFGKYAANTSIASTSIIGIHTAGTTKAATIQSVHITNRSDAGAFPVDILLTDSTGIVTTYLVKNLVIPKYSAVEILEKPKRMEIGSSLGVKVQQTGTIDVIVSGKTYS